MPGTLAISVGPMVACCGDERTGALAGAATPAAATPGTKLAPPGAARVDASPKFPDIPGTCGVDSSPETATGGPAGLAGAAAGADAPNLVPQCWQKANPAGVLPLQRGQACSAGTAGAA